MMKNKGKQKSDQFYLKMKKVKTSEDVRKEKRNRSKEKKQDKGVEEALKDKEAKMG